MEKLFEILIKKTPFDSFVSKRYKKDFLDIPDARKSLDKDVTDLIGKVGKEKDNHILTIVGDSGLGKTHFFWVLYNSLDLKKPNFYLVYLSPQDTKIKDIYFNLCTNVLADLGEKTLDIISSRIIDIGGGKTTSLDMLGLIQIKKSPRTIIKRILQRIKLSDFEQNIIKVFIYLGSGTTFEKEIALKWLKKEYCSAKELKKLGIEPNDFTENEYEEIFKIITKFIGKPLVLFFDDIEYYQMIGIEEEFGQLIKKLYLNLNSILVILTSLSESWNYLKNVFETILEKELKNIKTLNNFTEKNIESFYLKSMDEFWFKNELNPPSDPLFPLNNKILKIIHLKSRGNPRLVIKLFKEAINQKIYEFQVENLWELKEVINR